MSAPLSLCSPLYCQRRSRMGCRNGTHEESEDWVKSMWQLTKSSGGGGGEEECEDERLVRIQCDSMMQGEKYMRVLHLKSTILRLCICIYATQCILIPVWLASFKPLKIQGKWDKVTEPKDNLYHSRLKSSQQMLGYSCCTSASPTFPSHLEKVPHSFRTSPD